MKTKKHEIFNVLLDEEERELDKAINKIVDKNKLKSVDNVKEKLVLAQKAAANYFQQDAHAALDNMNKKVILIPGNCGGSPKDNWFPSVKKELEAVGLTVIAEEFPDNDLARASFWLPFLINQLKADENTLLVGHSSGAIAAMRLAEKQCIWGSVLVGAYHTDLGMEKEKQSGYFDTPWDFKAIQKNQSWIAIFAAQNDPWIPIEEPRYLHSQLNCEYHEYKTGGHFGGDYDKTEFPELSQAIIRQLF